LAGRRRCFILADMPTYKEAAELLAARVRAGERVVLADADRVAEVYRDDAGFHFEVPHAQYLYRRLFAEDPGEYLAGVLAALLYAGLAVEGVAVTWPPLPVDEWLRHVDAGERLHLLARRGPHYDLTLARSAGWYVLVEGREQRCDRTPTHLGERLAAVDPASDPEARFDPYADGLRDPFVEPGFALQFSNNDANYPWDLTLHRLESGRFAEVEQWADLHDSMGGHLAGEERREVDEDAARAKVARLLTQYFPRVVKT
jgi:hypothetical protein